MVQLETGGRMGVTNGDAGRCCKTPDEAQSKAPVHGHPARRRTSPALKHGAYSEAVLMPGEDPAAFRRLHRDLIEELSPTGRLEEETVASIARLVWRRQNLANFAIGQIVELIALSIENTPPEKTNLPSSKEELLAGIDELDQAARRMEKEKESRKSSMDFLEVASKVALDRLMKELELEERLDTMIERLIKRLMYLKGLKSIMSSTAITSPLSVKSARGPADMCDGKIAIISKSVKDLQGDRSWIR
jgi:hypothetical protein